MPNVTVSRPNSIKVTVGSAGNPRITSTAQFTGATSANLINQIQTISDTANAAFVQANSSYILANTSYVIANGALQLSGGEITGNLMVDGTFTATLDGGSFS